MKRPTAEEAARCTSVLSEIAQSIDSLSEKELREHVKSSGRDPDKVIADTRSLISSAIANANKSKLRSARAGLDAARRSHKAQPRSSIPRDPVLQRNLLERLASQNAQIPQRLTMAFRDRTNLSHSDLESILRDLERLGLLSGLL